MKCNAVVIFAVSLGLSFGVTIGVMKEVQQRREEKENREKKEVENRKYEMEYDIARRDFHKKYSSVLAAIVKRRFKFYGQLIEHDKEILSAVKLIPSNGNEYTEKIKRPICRMLENEILECEIRIGNAKREGEVKQDELGNWFGFGYNIFSDLKSDLFLDD